MIPHGEHRSNTGFYGKTPESMVEGLLLINRLLLNLKEIVIFSTTRGSLFNSHLKRYYNTLILLELWKKVSKFSSNNNFSTSFDGIYGTMSISMNTNNITIVSLYSFPLPYIGALSYGR